MIKLSGYRGRRDGGKEDGREKMVVIYIVENDVVGGYAIGCDEEEVFWGGRRVDVANLALGK